ncbi:3-oxoacyl-[acyl-carrier-protein] synthase III C-terminal domain-containing protein [Streptomyces sp. Li-HN-5-11]|uniref:type III polyketide synthase n=1 Tax=Streptomyces sp. Li-HN-5-11 TaxID=3075432 RepID=UPI0028AAB633|nr:3-oxoacyl-[acyl-carrier-protein] synthase III C-terminal domain-containing protein [Streptomyces sp. Li-HN-5-11]WNM32042.1 3-oxoacyl-[acyl-carrier-protein] synthase III C-terminal domain-containing protein [Streptomyces sp. Li-HN-5-11]WOP39188.1 3-oxoacyl-[acyl-carrier-protein] synthase III C-terminal domain-containing protein [Streptomyces sp. Li-HN-5-13]
MRVPAIADPAPSRPTAPRRTAVPGAETTVAAVRTALPPHRYAQEDLTEPIGDLCLAPGADRALLRRLHASAGVRTRHLALPIERYAQLGDFGQSNDAWLAAALELGEEALAGALRAAGLRPADVDLLVCASITGVAAPSLDARLAGRMGLRPDVKRVPVFGLGCVAGAAGLARVHDYLRGHPDDTAVLLTVELCSLTLQRRDGSRANLVAGALFGDGAAALVARGGGIGGGCAGPEAAGPTVVATRSRLYPDTERLLGWDIGAGGFRVVIDAGVPGIVRDHFGRHLRAFLAEHRLTTDDIGTWVCHPGGPRVLSAVADTLGLPGHALDTARHSLATVGNMSSVSVLHILQTTWESHRPEPGTWGLVMAMGPGFCSELVLLRW